MPTCQHLNYETHGDNNSPAMLLLHGFLGSGNEWIEISEILKKNFFIILPDLPGHGRTMPSTDSDYTMPAAAQALMELLKQEEVKKCSLIGYSMGGRLALLMALNHPEQFSSVVVESASPGLKTEYERSERVASDRKIIERLRTQTMAEFLSGWYSQPLFDSIRQNSARFQKLLKDRSANKAEGLCKSLEYMGTGVQPPLWDKLSELNLPGLLIVGADDNKFKSIAGEMAKRSETISARIIDGSGHNVHFEKPQEFAFELQKFLR